MKCPSDETSGVDLKGMNLILVIPGYNEDDSPTFLDAVSDVSTNGSADDPVPLMDDQAESMLLLQVEPPTSPLLVPHENVRHPPSVLVTEITVLSKCILKEMCCFAPKHAVTLGTTSTVLCGKKVL